MASISWSSGFVLTVNSVFVHCIADDLLWLKGNLIEFRFGWGCEIQFARLHAVVLAAESSRKRCAVIRAENTDFQSLSVIVISVAMYLFANKFQF